MKILEIYLSRLGTTYRLKKRLVKEGLKNGSFLLFKKYSQKLKNSDVSESILRCSVIKKFSVSPRQLSAESHDHSKLWTVERVVAMNTLALVPAAFIFQSPFMDCLISLLLVMHSHWGLEAIIVDYMRPRVVGPVLPKVSMVQVAVEKILKGHCRYFTIHSFIHD
ncbi:hypothetical protein J437_LFUL002772 [Ladona fulva]|uniref:Succinate dehydrogenase [ubiquinone] cytochrome b small subunit n=1 Tax=Ladona fulva TaxID=123851 RepID=A0A8K0JT84_LADFU|nr:hypothetical protein J437_LFUL002772 [Ladona fulva]